MQDKELLELAAKAAGVDCDAQLDDGTVVTAAEAPIFWNPLTDDGDALRLAVHLRITPHIDENMTDCEDCTEAHIDDPDAATRRAIVRAAAEIGKTMP